jgi:coenzyme PQQ precursor peptide PqqA
MPRLCGGGDISVSWCGTATGAPTMRWETPQAIDMRFGMEITLYIARR